MLSRNPDSISLSNLKDIDPANLNWFGETSRTALAGRCLLDALQYLRAIPSFSAQFREVTNAHTIRLVCQCLADSDLQGRKFLKKIKPHVVQTCNQLRAARKNSVPHYGDDFWDWAVVLQAFLEVHESLPNAGGLTDAKITEELVSFYENVESKMETGLTVPANKDKEWYGPATAAVAYHIIDRYRDRFGAKVDGVIEKMREYALVQINAGEYAGRKVQPYQQAWHYGQVVAVFPVDTRAQASFIADFSYLDNTSKAERIYALARVLQGAAKVADDRTVAAVIEELYGCEDQGRPLGQGLMGDNIKGSLNVLEALWPMLEPGQKRRIRTMVDTLMQAHLIANTVGIVVAIGNEMDAAKQVFKADNAQIVLEELGTTVFKHEDYHVVVCGDKAIMGAHEATKKLIGEYGVKRLIMFGIAGSLAEFEKEQGKPPRLKGRGPDIFDVVIATSLAPFLIYHKIRETIENAGVPFRGKVWRAIPTDPVLFGLAHEAAEKLSGRKFYEGLIVTGTAVVDLGAAKADVLKEFPGGLAAETEGYTVGLLCLQSGVAYLVIRGISDPADGSKREQAKDEVREKKEQMQAAVNAGEVAAGVVKLLSRRW